MVTARSAAILTALMTTICATAASPAHAAPIMCPTPGLTICEAFDSSAANFSTVGGTWTVGAGTYRLTSPTDVSSLGVQNRAVHSTPVNGNFTLNVDASVRGTSETTNDLGVVFGYQNPTNYYVAIFSESNSSTSNGLFRILNGVQSERVDFAATIRSDTMYAIRIVRNGGSVSVYRDGILQGTASDSTFLNGQIGVGSRDDEPTFDNLSVAAAAAPSDTTGPVTAITAPASGATVSATTSVTASASDNVGVAGVQFKLDGANLRSEDTTSPYSTSWDTSTATNGSHVLTSVARDAAGNVTTSAGRTVTVSNGSSATPPPAPPPAPPPPPPAPPPPPPSSGTFGVGNWPGASWRPFASTSPFYQALPASPRLTSNSAAVVNRLFSLSPPDDSDSPPDRAPKVRVGAGGKTTGTPIYHSTAADPVFNVTCVKYGGGCGLSGQKIHIPAGAIVEGGKPAQPGGSDFSGDAHLTVVDQANGYVYDLWQVQKSPIPSSGGTLNVSWGGKFPLNDNGVSPQASGSSTAANYNDIIGRIRAEELQAAEIPHAISVVMWCQSNEVVYPATGKGTVCPNPTNAPAMGSRFQLNYTEAEIDALNAPPHRKAIYKAMAKYGLFFGDTDDYGLFKIETDSDYSYTSFGHSPRWLNLAKTTPGWSFDGSDYRSDLNADGIDWHRLRVIAPCVSQRTC